MDVRHAVTTAVAAALLVPAPASAARVVPRCTTVAVAGASVFCAGQERDETGHPRAIRVYRSPDSGRTWAAAGSVVATPGEPEALLVALAVAGDTLVLQTTRALHASTDAGATFRVLDAHGGGQYADALTPVTAGSRALLLNATPVYETTGASATDVATGAHVPGGAPGAVLRFLAAGDAVHAVVRDSAGALTIRSCVVASCVSPLAALPAGATYAGGGSLGDAAYVVTRESGALRTWRWTGTAYARWPAVDALAAGAARLPGAAAELRVTAAPDQSRTLYALVTHRSSSRAVAAHQVFRSVDGGASWGRKATGWSARQGRASALPWNAPVRGATGGGWQVAALPGGRLVVVAAAAAYEGPFCSADAGRSWARTC